jgi:hypothetical protein
MLGIVKGTLHFPAVSVYSSGSLKIASRKSVKYKLEFVGMQKYRWESVALNQQATM